MRPHEHEIADMPAFYEKERPAIFSAYSAMMIVSLFQNWWDRKTYGLNGLEQLKAEGIVLGMLVLTLTAGWARPRLPPMDCGSGHACIADIFPGCVRSFLVRLRYPRLPAKRSA